MASMQYVVVYGNAFDGLTLVGPFSSENAAVDYAEMDAPRESNTWHVVLLQEPASD